MSIEDINYLYKNSIKDNAIIFVDSSKRDKSIFPNPNKYNITFSNPFKLVYGLEVIEASIPRTMYQIDKYNNNFKIIIGDANYDIFIRNKYDFYNNPDTDIDFIEDVRSEQNNIDSSDSTNNIFNYGFNNSIYFDNNTNSDGEEFTTGIFNNEYNIETSQNSNGSLLWLRDITINPQDMNINSLIDKINSKLSDLPLDTNNSYPSLLNNRKIRVKGLTDPAANTSKLLFYSGDDPDSTGNINNSVKFYLLGFDSNMKETIGFDENAQDNSNDYSNTINDLEKRNIFMLLYNISIKQWKDVVNIIVSSNDTLENSNIYTKKQWEGSDSFNNSLLSHRDRTLVILDNINTLSNFNNSNIYNLYLIFENNIQNQIFVSDRDKGDIGSYDLHTDTNNNYSVSRPNFGIKQEIEYIVKWVKYDTASNLGGYYTIKNKYYSIGQYPNETNNPTLEFKLNNSYKFDLSDSSNRIECNIISTNINNLISSGENKDTITIFYSLYDSITFRIVDQIEQTNDFIKGNNSVITSTNLVNLINKSIYFNSQLIQEDNNYKINIQIINLNLNNDLVLKFGTNAINTDINTGSDTGLEISQFNNDNLFRFSTVVNGLNSAERVGVTDFNSFVEYNNVQGTDNSYVIFNALDQNLSSNDKNEFLGTPNTFYYNSNPLDDYSADSSLRDNSVINSGNSITLNRKVVHRIQTPGLINLTGERFVVLKSKNIEEHMQKNDDGTTSTGIGLFKVSTIGYNENRLDFTTYKPKDFHPIGKLTHIDLTFENINNLSYDFKGVNHTLLINIKYYVPTANLDKFNYVLNQNYTPDFINYRKTQYEKDNNSDDELDHLAQNFNQNFLEKEKEFVYSSDEDLDNISPPNNLTDSDTETSSEDDYIPSNNNHITPYNPFY